MSQQPEYWNEFEFVARYMLFEHRKKQFTDWTARQFKKGINLVEDATYKALAEKFENQYIKPLEKLEKEFQDGRL